LYPAFAADLEKETGVDVELDQTGTLYVGFTQDDEHEMRRRLDWQTRESLRVEWLSGKDARQLEPNLSSSVRCALRFPNDWQVENRRLTEALLASNRRLGVRLISNSEIRSVRINDGRVTGIESEKTFINSPTVVIAAGAWTSTIGTSATNSAKVLIEPVRGQMLCFQTEPPLTRHVIYSARGYLVPRRDGRLLAGSTSEHVGFDKRVTDEGAAAIKSMAFEIAPPLESTAIADSWAGFRPHAPDDLPVLGPAADIDGLFYATGHYRNGILLAPITANIVADALVNRTGSPFLEIFSPDRFRLAAAGR
jgi:glycine oxidase